MSKLTIVAHIRAKPDQIDFVKAELIKLIEPTRKDEGFLQYDLHQENGDSAHFMFYENWENRELWQAHVNSAHIAAFAKATEDALAKPSIIFEMTPVG